VIAFQAAGIGILFAVFGGIVLPWGTHEAAADTRVSASAFPVSIVRAACPVVHPPASSQHVSHGDIVVTSPAPVQGANGMVVQPTGQTIFYAGRAPKLFDSGSQASKAPAPHPASSSTVASAGGEVAARPATPPHPTSSTKSGVRVWTVQVASYETLDDAQALETSLCNRGYDARITGSGRAPFTVQVGAYPSSDSAMVVARHLSSPEFTVFVTQAKR
jgi:cell division septation protein DedD